VDIVLKFPTEGDSRPVKMVASARSKEEKKIKEINSRQLISKRLSSPIRMTSLRLSSCQRLFHPAKSSRTNLLTIIAPSSMMQPVPMTIGPAIAKIVALGWTMVPARKKERGIRRRFGELMGVCLTGAYGNVSFEFNILTNNGFRVDCELVASKRML
jgi:hypothetical protein